MKYVPIYKICQILIAVPLTGLWVLGTATLLPFKNNENNGGSTMIPRKILATQIASAQPSTLSIVPEANSTNTAVTPVTPSRNSDQTRFDITGGKRSQNDGNLFHSFNKFNLRENRIVNSISAPNT